MSPPLSSLQQQLIHLLVTGASDAEIASEMAFTDGRLQDAFAELCVRLGVANRIELILWIWSPAGFAIRQQAEQKANVA